MLRSVFCRLGLGILLNVVIAIPLVHGESVLNFPRLSAEAGSLTGATFVNPNPQPAAITVTAYRSNGTLVSGPGIQNPASLMVPANQQLGLLTADPRLFGPDLDPNTVGWFQATSPADGVTGFFLFLDEGGITYLDGADLPPTGRKIAFNEVRLDQGASTELNLINPSDVPTGLDLLLVDGEQIFESNPAGIDLSLAGKGSARLDVAQWFGVNEVSPGAYVLVLSDTPVGGFELVRFSPRLLPTTGVSPVDLLGLNARCLNEEFNSIYFPQLAVLGPIRMEIGVTNYAPESATLFITAYQPDGSPYGDGVVERNRVVRNLGPGQALREDVQQMFGFQGEEAVEGWIQVESTVEAVNGYVTYGLPGNGSIAAVAAPARPTRRAIFSHIATTLGFFTGVAALNPSSLAADLRVVAIRPDGTRIGVYDTVLNPGQRISQLLDEMIPEAAGQAGGVVWVSSNRGLYLTSLFGNNFGSVLANIPPQPVPDSYQPDLDVAKTRVAPSLAVVETGDSTSFGVSGPATQPDWSLAPVGGFSGPLGTIDGTGLYQAPTDQPDLPVTVVADVEGSPGSATVDVLTTEPFEPGVDNVLAVTYSEVRRVLYAAQATDTGTDLIRVDPGSTTFLHSFDGELGGLITFQDFTGREYVLVTERSSGFLVRYDPFDDQTRDVFGEFDNPGGMAFDPVTGNLLVVDNAGVTEVPRSHLESDVASGLTQNGSPPRLLVATSDIGGVAVDGCDGRVYYSHSTSGEIRRFDPRSGIIETVATDLQAPGAIIGLQRRDAACGDSFHLLVTEASLSRVTLVALDEGIADFWPTPSQVNGLELLTRDNPFSGTESVVEIGSTGLLTRVPATRLYQNRAVNPLDAHPIGILSDPINDLFRPLQTQLDLVEVSAFYDETSLEVAVTFADPVDPARGLVELDTDSNPETGVTGATDFNSPYSSGLGVDFCVDLCDVNLSTAVCEFDPSGGSARLFQAVGGQLVQVGTVDVEYFDYYLVVTLPRELLEGAGQVRISTVFGPPEAPSDASPNGGYLVSQEVVSLTSLAAARPVPKVKKSGGPPRRGFAGRTGTVLLAPGRGWRKR